MCDQDVRSGLAYVSELAQIVVHLVSVVLNFRSDESFRSIIQIFKVCTFCHLAVEQLLFHDAVLFFKMEGKFITNWVSHGTGFIKEPATIMNPVITNTVFL